MSSPIPRAGVPIDPPLLFPLELPPGFVLAPARGVDPSNLEELLDLLLIWEAPRRDSLYVLSADVSEGLGLDRCSADVTRVGTITEPNEQVAQFVSSRIDPIDFASVLDVMGRLYRGKDGLSALLAIEINGPGTATQSQLARAIGYDNLWIWEYEDAADPSRRRSTRMGWVTGQRTRLMMLTRYIRMVKKVDQVTGLADYVVNSPHTIAELRDFNSPDGSLYAAEADPTNPDSHDDCIMSGAIGQMVVATVQESEGESLADTRRRKSEERARQKYEEERLRREFDFRSMEYTAEEMAAGADFPDDYMGPDPRESE